MTVELDAGRLDLARFVRPGDVVVVAQSSSEPLTLTEALVAQSDALGELTVFIGLPHSDTFAPDRAPRLRYASYGAHGSNARLARAGRLEVVPCHYSQLPWLVSAGPVKPDVVMLALSPAVDGVATLGAAHGFALAATTRARVVLAEVNDRMPWVYGGELPAGFRVDGVVRTSRPLPGYPVSRVGQVEREVAANVAALIPDGATLQFGVGTMADAVLGALGGHRDLGFHTGMLPDAALPLLERGVANNRLKPIDTGVTVNGVYIGDEALYRYIHRNPATRLAGPEYTHAIATLARIPGFVSINSAVEIDLAGNVNAEVAGGAYVGGVGGQLDFVRGAAAAPGGRAIIALPSVSRDGKTSRIVERCAAVTTPAADADTIVTEWGVAELRGVSFEARAKRIAAIAHPAFRDGLAAARR
jgi:acetyl-CoA hydrolase